MAWISLLLAVFLISCCGLVTEAAVGQGARFAGHVGAIVNLSTRNGRLQKCAMELAVEDYTASSSNGLSLHVRDSQGVPTRAAYEAKSLINDQRVQTIVGLETWRETAAVADVGNQAELPVLSISKESPSWAAERWPFLVHFARSHSTQVKALSAILSSWQWRTVSVIYEDSEYIGSSFLPELTDAIREANSGVDFQLGISPFSSLSVELEKLKSLQSKVFVVHTSLPLATRLFVEAKRKGMTETGYAWIATDRICDALDSVGSSVISSMQGLLCLKNYFPQTNALVSFSERLQRKLKQEYPEEETPVYAGFHELQLYDGIWAVAEAMDTVEPRGNYSSFFQERKDPEKKKFTLVFTKGHQLLEGFLAADFPGLSGRLKFSEGMLVPPRSFEVINVVGRSYREISYWTDGLGFSLDLTSNDSTPMSTLSAIPIFWPGGSSVAPKGGAPPISKMSLRIGVPAISAFPDYVSAKYDSKANQTLISGFCIDVFKRVVERLPYSLSYELVAYYGSYDSLVEQVPAKVFDAVVGDTNILSYRCEFVQFTQPYTQSGYVMVVPVLQENSNKASIIVKPFSSSLWISILALWLVKSLVVWLIEMGVDKDKGRAATFADLFVHEENIQSNLSRAIIKVWALVGLILTSTYTAILSSMLTVQRLKPSVTDINQLKSTGAVIGCNKGGSILKFINQYLGFPMSSIRQFAHMDDYVQAFRNGEIKAAIFAVGHAKMFLAKYCKEFTTAGPTYHAGGFGFIFPKGSPLLPDVTEAILKVFESGTMQQLEDGLVSSYNCSSSTVLGSESDRMGSDSFGGLFAAMLVTCGVVVVFHGYSLVDPGNKALLRLCSASIKWLRETLLKIYKAVASCRSAGNPTQSEKVAEVEIVPTEMPRQGNAVEKYI